MNSFYRFCFIIFGATITFVYTSSIYQGILSLMYISTLLLFLSSISSGLTFFIGFMGMLLSLIIKNPDLSFMHIPSLIVCIVAVITIYFSKSDQTRLSKTGNVVSFYVAYKKQINNLLKILGLSEKNICITVAKRLRFNAEAPLYPLFEPTEKTITFGEYNDHLYCLEVTTSNYEPAILAHDRLIITTELEPTSEDIVAVCKDNEDAYIMRLTFNSRLAIFMLQDLKTLEEKPLDDRTNILGKVIEIRRVPTQWNTYRYTQNH